MRQTGSRDPGRARLSREADGNTHAKYARVLQNSSKIVFFSPTRNHWFRTRFSALVQQYTHSVELAV